MKATRRSCFASIVALAIVASSVSGIVSAAPPPAPQVTIGTNVKQLLFQWEPVSGATHYRLMYRVAHGNFKPLIDDIPAATTKVTLSVAVHTLSWTLLRYAVAACNSTECSNSAEVPIAGLMLDTIGYFKASNAGAGDRFGSTVVLSDDGRMLVTTAHQEDSSATGINGNQADNGTPNSGAVYVFRRATAGWRQEAYIKAGVSQPQLRFGSDRYLHRRALAISADGTVLAVGAAEQTIGGKASAGMVYVYQRRTSGSWMLAQTLTAPTPLALDRFGFSVDLSRDGRTLKVDGYAPWSATNGKPLFRSHIFVRPGTDWLHSVSLGSVDEGSACENTRLSGDGGNLVMICEDDIGLPRMSTYSRSENSWFAGRSVGPIFFWREGPRVGFAVDDDASHMAMQDTRSQLNPLVVLYGGNFWEEGFFSPSGNTPDPGAPRDFGNAVALTRTADMIAIADKSAAEGGAGVSMTSMPGDARRGAVYVWKRVVGPFDTTWPMRSVVKSPNPDDGDAFAMSLSLSGNGSALAVGAELEDSKATGVDGDRNDDGLIDSGAVYLY